MVDVVVNPADEVGPYVIGNYLPNQFLLDLNMLIWTNPNNIMTLFSPRELFEVFCSCLHHSIGKTDYSYHVLYDWVEEEICASAYFNGSDANLIWSAQQDVLSAFCHFITNNRVYVQQTLIPELRKVIDLLSVRQDDASGTVRLQYW